jgi:hypothetical protein
MTSLWSVNQRPLLVGELNPYQPAEDEDYALYPYPERSAGGRLCRLVMGLEPHRYIRSYDRANLCSVRWSLSAARLRAVQLSDEHPVVPVALFGSRVCAAFGVPFAPFTVSGRYALLPHPSGLCRIWNEPEAYDRARVTLRVAGVLS